MNGENIENLKKKYEYLSKAYKDEMSKRHKNNSSSSDKQQPQSVKSGPKSDKLKSKPQLIGSKRELLPLMYSKPKVKKYKL